VVDNAEKASRPRVSARPLITGSMKNYTLNFPPSKPYRNSRVLVKPSRVLRPMPAPSVARAAQAPCPAGQLARVGVSGSPELAPIPLPCCPAPTRCQEEAERGRGGRHSGRDVQHQPLPEPWPCFPHSQTQKWPRSQPWTHTASRVGLP